MQINQYFDLGSRDVPTEIFENTIFDIIYNNNYDELNIINMLIGSIHYGNYKSCDCILHNYNFSLLSYNNDFIDFVNQAVEQLQYLIEEDDEEALDTLYLVNEAFPFLQYNCVEDSVSILDEEDESNISDNSEAINTMYDSY